MSVIAIYQKTYFIYSQWLTLRNNIISPKLAALHLREYSYARDDFHKQTITITKKTTLGVKPTLRQPLEAKLRYLG
jgi:hypothetical protein